LPARRKAGSISPLPASRAPPGRPFRGIHLVCAELDAGRRDELGCQEVRFESARSRPTRHAEHGTPLRRIAQTLNSKSRNVGQSVGDAKPCARPCAEPRRPTISPHTPHKSRRSRSSLGRRTGSRDGDKKEDLRLRLPTCGESRRLGTPARQTRCRAPSRGGESQDAVKNSQLRQAKSGRGGESPARQRILTRGGGFPLAA